MLKDRWITEYCQGQGVEIGGADNAVQGINTIKIDNTDKFAEKNYLVDHMADATELELFSDDSVDFVISIHVLEHITNPIKALLEWNRIVKPGEFVFTAVPKRSKTFDRYRLPTPLHHLLEDFGSDVDALDSNHLMEWNELSAPCVYHVNGSPLAPDEQVVYDTVRQYCGEAHHLNNQKVKDLWAAIEQDKIRHRDMIGRGEPLGIHHHVWEHTSEIELLLKTLGLVPVKIVDNYLSNSMLFVTQVVVASTEIENRIEKLKRGDYPDWVALPCPPGNVTRRYHGALQTLPPMSTLPVGMGHRLRAYYQTHGLSATLERIGQKARRKISG